MSPRRSTWLPIAAGLLVSGAALLFFLSFDEPWALRGENKVSLFPMVADAWRQWGSGHFPAWTSGMWGGFPLFAGSQSNALYLPDLLAFALTPAPHWRAMDLVIALHAGWLSAGCVVLLLRLGARTPGALLGGLLAPMAPHVVYWTSFVPMFVAIAWWPWLFLAADRLTEAERPARGAVVLGAVALAAQVYAGYVEYAFYSGCFAAVWMLACRDGAPIGTRCLRLALLALSAGMLAAPQLLPTALSLEPTRSLTQLAPPGLEPSGPLAVLDPREGGRSRVLPSVFLGAATLVLAGCALALRARRSARLAALAAATALVSLGDATPAYGWLTALPVFDLFRTPFKFFVATDVFVILLAALGFAALRSRPSRRARVAAGCLGALALLEYGVHLSLELPLVVMPHLRDEVRVPRDLAAFESFLPDLLARNGQDPPPRVLHVARANTFGSLGEVYGVESILGASPALLGERQATLLRHSWLEGEGWIDRSWIRLLGVQRVVVRGACRRFGGRGLSVVRSEDGECLLRNPQPAPRVELLPGASPVPDLASELARVKERPGGEVPVVLPATREAPAWSTAGPLEPGEGAQVLAYRPGVFELRTQTARERLLLVRESRNGGWHAQIDGRPAPILPAAGLFFAIPVPAGEHLVRARYEVPGLATAFALAAVWLVAVGALAWRERGAGRRAPDPVRS